MVFALAAEARAQPLLAAEASGSRRVSAAAGWDPVWALMLGYTHRLPLPVASDTELQAGLALPLLLAPWVDGGKVWLGMKARFDVTGRWAIAVGASTSLAWADDSTGFKAGWGLELAAQPGWYGSRWTFALDVSWRKGLATYVRHSQAVRALFEERPAGAAAGPRDGWYAFPAQRLRGGLMVGVRLTERVSLNGGGGLEWTPQAQSVFAQPSLGQLPFYMLLGGDYRW